MPQLVIHSNSSKPTAIKAGLTENTNRIIVSDSDGFSLVQPNEISYLQADGNYCVVQLVNGQAILSSRCLKDYQMQLDAARFLRIHHGILVNLSQVVRFSHSDGGHVKLASGKLLPVSRRRRKALLQQLLHATSQ